MTSQRNLVSVCTTPQSERVSDHPPDKSDDESESEPEPEPDEEDALPPLGKGERNSQLTVGYKGDRSYVVRGGKIGVFAHTGDNQVKYHASIGNLATPKGKEFVPNHVSNPSAISSQLKVERRCRSCCTIKTQR